MSKQSKIHWVFLTILYYLLTGCGGGGGSDPASNSAVYSNLSLDRLGAAVSLGNTVDINVTPILGTLEVLTVSSSDPNVATVSTSSAVAGQIETITVNAVTEGSVIVTASTQSGDSRNFPVTVYDPLVMDVGDMLIKIVDKFEYRWNDRNSGASLSYAAFHPIAPQGYKTLASIGAPSYASNIDGTTWAIVVKDKGTNTDHPPMVDPESYTEIISWVDWNNPFASVHVKAWRPVCPTNLPDEYVAMGTVVGGDGTSGAVCLRKDLTDYGVSEFKWNDANSGSALPVFSLWQINARERSGANSAYTELEKAYVATGSIVIMPDRTDPLQNNDYRELTRILKIKPKVLIDAEYPGWEPTLTSVNIEPSSDTQPILTKAIMVPFTAFTDPNVPNLNWQVVNSPFYVLERTQYWNKEWWGSSGGSRTWTVGISDTNTQASWQQTSVETTNSYGFELKGVSGSMTSTVTETLGFATSTAVSVFSEDSTTVNVGSPPAGSKIAVYRKRNQVTLWRQGDIGLDQFLTPLVFDENAFISTCYPGDCI